MTFPIFSHSFSIAFSTQIKCYQIPHPFWFSPGDHPRQAWSFQLLQQPSEFQKSLPQGFWQDNFKLWHGVFFSPCPRHLGLTRLYHSLCPAIQSLCVGDVCGRFHGPAALHPRCQWLWPPARCSPGLMLFLAQLALTVPAYHKTYHTYQKNVLVADSLYRLPSERY